MIVKIEFRPTGVETQTVLRSANVLSNKDPATTYGTILSATLVAAAILGLSEEAFLQQLPKMLRLAKRAVATRPDIFGERT